MYRPICLTVFLVIVSISCNRQEKNTAPSEGGSPKTAKDHSQGRQATVPAVEEVIFMNADTVLVFPGYLAGIVDEEVFSRDRAPLITQDGGESWNKLSPQTIKFESVAFTNVSLGWVVKQAAELWKTTDGGDWTFVSNIGDDRETLNYSMQIKFVDELNGWILDLDSLWHTADGGQTWSQHEFPYLVASFFFHGNAVWVVSLHAPERNNAIFRSRDGGLTWDEIEVPDTMSRSFDSLDKEDLFFVDEQRGWLINARGVYRTDDCGNSWEKQRLPKRQIQIKSLCFLNEQEGWAAGWRVLNERESEFDAILLHTTNGGGTWQQVDVGVKQTFFDKVYFGDAQNGWLVAKEAGEGEDSFIQNANIYRTRDGGVTWRKVLSVKSPYSPG